MIIILDTNVLLASFSKKSIYRPIFDSLIDGKFQLVISNDILSEYTEIIERKTNIQTASNVAELLLGLDNLTKVEIYYEWKLIQNDPEDNKFVDAAISGGADFIVTNDQHFSILKSVDFPKVNVISVDDFLDLIQNKN